jgi:hypothetical protein
MNADVAPNGINTIVVPSPRVFPHPDHVGGKEQLPERNPSVTIDVPDEPESRVSIAIDGQALDPEQFAIVEQRIFFTVPPIAGDTASGRVCYVVDGVLRLLTFTLHRAEDVDALMDSLLTQFDNMSDLVERSGSAQPSAEVARGLQARLINAMELLPWTPEEYDRFHARAGELDYTAVS